MNIIADDVWFEIFLHLSLTAIFKSNCVSKVWLSILSNPNFIKKWYQLNYLSLPWAFVGYAIDNQDNGLRRNFTIAYPVSHSQFINDHPYGFSFKFLNSIFPNNNDQGRRHLYLRSSSNGLVLCYIRLHSQITFCVCNPLTQKSVLLPPTPTKVNGVAGLLCKYECFSSAVISASYKVIRIPQFEAAAKEFKVEMFCSDSGEWKVYGVSCPAGVTWQICIYDNFLTHNGVFYWFQRENNKILAFSVNEITNHGTQGIECRLVNLPDQASNMDRCLGESEGLLCYAIVKDTDKSLSVWVLEGDWYLLRKDNQFNDTLVQMECRLIGGATTGDLIADTRVLGFNPFDKNVVILGYKNHVWAYNTKTRAYEQLCHPSFPGSNLPSGTYMGPGPFTFALKPSPTILPPVSWRDTSTLDGNINELDN